MMHLIRLKVWVDVGDKRYGIEALLHYLVSLFFCMFALSDAAHKSIEGEATCHMGDRFTLTGAASSLMCSSLHEDRQRQELKGRCQHCLVGRDAASVAA